MKAEAKGTAAPSAPINTGAIPGVVKENCILL